MPEFLFIRRFRFFIVLFPPNLLIGNSAKRIHFGNYLPCSFMAITFGSRWRPTVPKFRKGKGLCFFCSGGDMPLTPLNYVDQDIGELIKYLVFIAVLPYSNFIDSEVYLSNRNEYF